LFIFFCEIKYLISSVVYKVQILLPVVENYGDVRFYIGSRIMRFLRMCNKNMARTACRGPKMAKKITRL